MTERRRTKQSAAGGRRRRHAPAAALVALGLAFGLGACNGGDGGDGQEAPATSDATPAATGTTPGPSASPPAGTPTPGATGTAEGTSTETAGGYVVQPGDTLSSIAVEHGTTVEALVEANDIADPDVIAVGQELVIP